MAQLKVKLTQAEANFNTVMHHWTKSRDEADALYKSLEEAMTDQKNTIRIQQDHLRNATAIIANLEARVHKLNCGEQAPDPPIQLIKLGQDLDKTSKKLMSTTNTLRATKNKLADFENITRMFKTVC